MLASGIPTGVTCLVLLTAPLLTVGSACSEAHGDQPAAMDSEPQPSGRVAQGEGVATPLSAEELAGLWGAMPADPTLAGFVQVGALLDPARFEHFLSAMTPPLGALTHDAEARVAEIRTGYDTYVRPVARSVRGCVVAVGAGEAGPTMLCLGDFGPTGWTAPADALSGCDGSDCGTTTTEYPGLTVTYDISDAWYQVNDRYLLVGPEESARAVLTRLSGGAPPGALPAVGGVSLDASALGHVVARLPDDYRASIRDNLAQMGVTGVDVDLVSLRLFEPTPAALGFELHLHTPSDSAAQQLSALVTSWLTAAASQMPAGIPGLDSVFSGTRTEGPELIIASTSGEALLGMLAAVAVPAFLQYIRRSKTTEAVMNVRRLNDSAVSYYDSDHTDASGAILPPQFPDSVARTPATVPCGEQATPNPADWEAPTWQALNFAVVDPHYYSYQFDSAGVGPAATFTATAFGDLDCDGVFSTFVRLGSVTSTLEARGGAGLYEANELE